MARMFEAVKGGPTSLTVKQEVSVTDDEVQMVEVFPPGSARQATILISGLGGVRTETREIISGLSPTPPASIPDLIGLNTDPPTQNIGSVSLTL